MMFKALMAQLLVSLLILQLAHSDETVMTPSVGSPVAKKIDCEGACNVRCQLSSRHKMCKQACGTCCDRCNCVPPGTSGHYELCPCYANMTTHGHKRKCP